LVITSKHHDGFALFDSKVSKWDVMDATPFKRDIIRELYNACKKPAPDLIPSFPYLTMKAKSKSPAGPWIKQKEVVPFRPKPDTYYSVIASPGNVIRYKGEYLQFFSATDRNAGNPCVQRTLGIARTKNLDGAWKIDPQPIVPIEEQVENSSVYYEKSNKTWFLFTNQLALMAVNSPMPFGFTGPKIQTNGIQKIKRL